MKAILILLLFSFSWAGFPESQGTALEEGKQETLQDSPDVVPTPLEFDEEGINKLREQPEFDYSEAIPQENWWTSFKRYIQIKWNQLMDFLFGGYQANAFLLFLIELLPYLIVGGILFLAVWLFSKINPAGSLLSNEEKGQVFLTEEEEIIHSRNISELIQAAVEEKNYRLAIRYHFLQALQLLTQRNLINYQVPKTDEDYLAELRIKPLQAQFKKITRIYDFIWYGNFEAFQWDYSSAQQEFRKMTDLINRAHEQDQ